ncbi:MAG TPA: ATP synthase F1 subunit delta [Chitinophagales bacterium]|nr:ATP synthase F1 subunit delta [Chitinophagales bacterium]
MRNPRVAYRYAKALIDFALEQNALDIVKKDIDLLRLTRHRELDAAMSSPVINGEKKGKIFSAIYHGRVSAITENFFYLLFKKSREFVLRDIGEAFDRQYNELKGIVVATLTSAIPLDGKLHDDIFNRVAALPRFKGKTLQLNIQINPEIIGGFILEVNDNKFDASIRHDLHFIKQEFIQNLYEMKY